MKILVVQLLRLGDVILSTPVMQGLKEQYPDAEIDLLINSQFKNVVSILPRINKCHTFDRNLIQSSLGEKERFVFEGFDRVNNLIQSLKSENYDLVVNLTHNTLSAYLVGAIHCQDRIGLWINDKNHPMIESSWFRYLDSDLGKEVFHFVDIFKYSAGVSRARLGIELVETASGIQFAEKYVSQFSSKKHIVVQTLTSDDKKNWGTKNFAKAILDIHAAIPNSHFTILGAPSEEKILRVVFENIPFCEILICDLDVALSVTVRSDLVISGDTSIKHLASSTDVPIIELSMGSSDLRRTGTYSDKAIIIQSKEACAPCSHTGNCHREKHFCSSRISTELVSMVAVDAIRNKSAQIKIIGEEFSDEASIFRVDIKTTGTWTAINVIAEFSEESIAQALRKFSTKLFVEHTSKAKDVFRVFGSESLKMASLLKSTYSTDSYSKIKTYMSIAENEFYMRSSQIEAIENYFYDHKNLNEKMCQDLNLSIDVEATLFVRMRKIQMALSEAKLKSEIDLKLVRSLQTMMEA